MQQQNNEKLNKTTQNAKSIWVIIPIFVTALIVGGGVYAWQNNILKSTKQTYQRQIATLQEQVNQLQQKIDSTLPEKIEEVRKPESALPSEVQQSALSTYKSSYGYLLKYPKIYDLPGGGYAVWTMTKEMAASEIEEWGVNKGQDTIFDIGVYPMDKQLEVLNFLQCKRLDQKVSWNNINAIKVGGCGGLDNVLVEKGKYFYIIKSSFSEWYNSPEYAEYYNILMSLEFPD